MSAVELSATLKQHIFNLYIDKSTGKSADTKKYFSEGGKGKTAKLDIRSKYESAASGHTNVFSTEGIKSIMESIVNSLEEDSNIKKEVINLFSKFNAYKFTQYIGIHYGAYTTQEEDGSYNISNIPQNKFNLWLLDFLETSSGHATSKEAYNYIKENIHAGHLAGVFSLKLKQALGAQINFKEGGTYRDFTVSYKDINDKASTKSIEHIESILKLLLDADYLTSNLTDREKIFTKATKSVLGDSPYLTTEIQFKKDNEEAGKLLANAGKKLNSLINSFFAEEGSIESRGSNLNDLYLSLEPLAAFLVNKSIELRTDSNNDLVREIFTNAKNIQKISDAFLNSEGSPSIKKGIGINLVSVIGTGTVKSPIITKVTSNTSVKTKVPEGKVVSNKIKSTSASLKRLKSAITVNNSKIKSLIAKTNFAAATKPPIVSLDVLLRTNLAAQIKSNMGTGNAKNILNYRTGRFAESATIERTTTSRAGMVSVFYNYMRNPYGTFSEGGKQQFPKTRDPKLLISKSIREIGATLVGNRMRAILV